MLKFTSLIVENFGPYKNKQIIDFTDDNGVIIVWGDNGRGKSTLLNAFRYALFGKVVGRGMRNHSLQQISNWESSEEGNYDFSTTLNMVHDGVQYELIRKYLLQPGITKPESDTDYREDIYLRKGAVVLSASERNHFISNIMPEEVSRFFLFDGELLKEYEDLLIDENAIGDKIKESIEKILGVPILVNGYSDLNLVFKEYQKELSKAAQRNDETNKIGTLLESTQEELKHHEEQFKLLDSDFKCFTKKSDELKEELSKVAKYKGLIEKKDGLVESKKEKEEILNRKFAETKELTKKAWKGMLEPRIEELILSLDEKIRILNEKKSNSLITQKLIEDLKNGIESGSCPVCEQIIDENIKEKMHNKLSSAFSNSYCGLTTEEENNLVDLSKRKATISGLNQKDVKEHMKLLENQIAELIVEINDLHEKITITRKELIGVDTLEIGSIESEYLKCLDKLKVAKDGREEERKKCDELSKTIKNLEDKLKKTSGDISLGSFEQKKEFCEDIKNLFSEGIELYRRNLKNKVEDDASFIFKRIANEPDYSGLKINENYGLHIVHKNNRIIEVRSSGYEHIVALSLIGALHKNAPLQGPVIMDSPFGRLDPFHKRKMTKALPDLSDQVILFVYKDEINEQEAREILGGYLISEYSLERVSAMNTSIKMI